MPAPNIHHRKSHNIRIEGLLSVCSLLILLPALFLVYRAKTANAPEDAVNINEADAGKIASTLGIKPQDAQQIVEFRSRIGEFDSCEQLLSIKAPQANATQAHRQPLLNAEHVRPILTRCIVRTPQKVFWRFWGSALALALLIFLLPPLLRARGVGGDPFVLPLALLVTGLGVAMLFSVKDPYRDHPVALHHVEGALICGILFAASALLSATARVKIKNWHYVWALAAFLLVFALMVFGSGPEGVKLNLLHVQPVELIKLFLVFYLAASLHERAELIADTTPRRREAREGASEGKAKKLPFEHLLPRKQDIGPVSVMFVGALVLFLVIKDMGPGLLMFGTFITMIYVLTGRSRFLISGSALILLGGMLGYGLHVGVFATRVDMWLHPFANSHPNGMQLGEAIWGISASGGAGSGLGLGMPGLIPRSGSDMAFASWAEETGIIGSLLIVLIFSIITLRGVRIALKAVTSFDRALAAGLTALLALQTLLIMAGVTGLFPLSGVAMPFLSYGNSALAAAFISIGILRSISAASEKLEPEPIRSEAKFAFSAFGLMMAGLMVGVVGISRLGQLQVLQSAEYATKTIQTPDRDHVKRAHINPRLLAMADSIDRGSIYDRNGQILATSRITELSHYFQDKDTARRMAAAHTRYYPLGQAAANLVGYLDASVGGPTGMERTYNAEMRGFTHYSDLLTDYRRRFGFGYHPRRGLDLHMTIDSNIQRSALECLVNIATKQKDELSGRVRDRGAFVLLDPATGDVLAAVTSPTFDPNALTLDKIHEYSSEEDAKQEHRFVDRSRFGFYPPGSTMKVATAACALDSLPDALQYTVTSDRVASPIKWKAGGKSYIRRHVREDEGDPSFGALTMGPALRVSSNIFYANLAATLGSELFRDTLVNRYTYSHVPTKEQFDADLPDIGYGQGRMLASPLEQAKMAACVASGGYAVHPRFATSLTMPGAVEEKDLPEDPVDRPREIDRAANNTPRPTAMRPETASTLQQFMRTVVTSGTARNIFNGMPFSVAGKTGSAQNETYDARAHSWFMGFAPCSNGVPARYAFACVIENGGYGRAAAAPVCRDVLKHLK